MCLPDFHNIIDDVLLCLNRNQVPHEFQHEFVIAVNIILQN